MSIISADFSAAPLSAITSANVVFKDLSTDVSAWYWDFGDGTSSTDQNPTHEYTYGGTSSESYTVVLTATSAGNFDIETKIDYITLYAETSANFSAAPLSAITSADVQFKDMSTGFGMSAWYWDFGDGTSSTDQNPSHDYVYGGTTSQLYTVTLTAVGSVSSDIETKNNYITLYAETSADFSAAPLSAITSADVQFKDLTTGDGISTWYWDFGDGTSSTDQNPSHTYEYSGTGKHYYTVSLSAYGSVSSDIETKTDYITIYSLTLTDFSAAPLSAITSADVQFKDMSTGFGMSAWYWDFGDGTSSTDQNPSHTYEYSGTTSQSYTVTLTTSGSVDPDSEIKVDYITLYSETSANFSAAPLSGVYTANVQFKNLSIGDELSASWDFGDGSTSTEQDPLHTYTLSGTTAQNYTVILTITSTTSSDSETKVGYVTLEPSSSGHIGAFYFGPVPSINVADLIILTATIREPTVQQGYSVSYTPAVVPMYFTIRTPYIIAYKDMEMDFVGTPRAGAAPLTVEFTAIPKGQGFNLVNYSISEYRWYFDYGRSPTVYESSTTSTISHTYEGYAGKKYTVRCCAMLTQV